ncbi:MAG TPA: AAA family ATPase [Candidatus Dormibacteraeota bacterium]|nr:AAA family ATPase [Candidatus Dormibacteraeota bacterium]
MDVTRVKITTPRLKKAKLAEYFSRRVLLAAKIITLVLAVGALYLLASGSGFGWTLMGLALAGLILQAWANWDLSNLPPSKPLSEASKLDDVLTAPLLAHYPSISKTAELWAVIKKQPEAVFLMNRLTMHPEEVEQIIQSSPVGITQVWEAAKGLALHEGSRVIDAAHVFAALLAVSPGSKLYFDQIKLDIDDLEAGLNWLRQIKTMSDEAKKKGYFGGIGRDWSAGYTPVLKRFGVNISRSIEAGASYRVTSSRQETIDRMLTYLQSSSRSSVALIGPPGSGKTTLVYGFAERILKGRQVGNLAYYQVVVLNPSLIISSQTSIEETVLTLLGEAGHAKNIILFLDDAQLFLNQGVGSVDLSQVLLPILQQSNIKLVMALTDTDWQKLKAAKPALATILNHVAVPNMSEPDVVDTLQESAVYIEHKSRALITMQAIKEALRLSDRYLQEEAFPGKAVRLLSDASNYPDGSLITAKSVQSAIESMTGVKAVSADETEKKELVNLEERIHKQMVNQSRAVSVVANALRRVRSGVGNPKRPSGSFLFLGPTGVGKTELAKALANVYFGGAEKMIRVDMSEYQQPSDATRLLAASPDKSSGSTLISSVRSQPFSVVLLDEVEKAHPDILNLLLQLLDEGHLTDSDGRKVSFKECIIIATSNASADEIRRRVEAGEDLADFEKTIISQLTSSHQFRQELLNRFDEIVLFRPLSKNELAQVVELMLAEVNNNLKPQKLSVELTPGAIQWMIEAGYDPRLGARPMRRVVQKAVENVVAKKILENKITSGETVRLDVSDIRETDNTTSQ